MSLIYKALYLCGLLITLVIESHASSSGDLVIPAMNLKDAVEAYIKETGADNFKRAFPADSAGGLGPDRHVVTVSSTSFDSFRKHLESVSPLFHFHEPNQHTLEAAFGNFRGAAARLEDPFRFTLAGTLLLPVLLTPEETRRTEMFFNLASLAKRKHDIALKPWLLKDAEDRSYCEVGSVHRGIAEWFLKIPLGSELDRTRTLRNYRIDTLHSQNVGELARQIWLSPYSRQSLEQVLDLKPVAPTTNFLTPARIAGALLGKASVERMPIVFRYVDDHRQTLDRNFNLWLDYQFDPEVP